MKISNFLWVPSYMVGVGFTFWDIGFIFGSWKNVFIVDPTSDLPLSQLQTWTCLFSQLETWKLPTLKTAYFAKSPYKQMNDVYNVAVVNQSRAATCMDTEGPCDNCDQKCLAKYGPSVRTQCGNSLCMCIYQCRPGPSPKTCYGGAGPCSQSCPDQCCDANCAKKYDNGKGYCQMLGSFSLCQCEYLC